MKTLSIVAIVLSLAGCATLDVGNVPATERLLAAAGFQKKPADTPAKLAHLERLPSRKILRRETNGQTHYVYADRNGCRCLYAGTELQYERYRALVRQQTMADEAVVVSEDAGDFRLWGPGPWP